VSFLTTTAKAIIVKKDTPPLLRRASFANWISGEFGMFYMNIRHNVKKDSSSKNTFHYLTRTAHFAEQKADEELEFVRSGNMPAWAVDAPASFWHSADRYEIARGRTSSTLTVALPKELSKQQRKELVEAFIQEFADQYQFPYTAAVHNHPSELTGEDQPHLHLMYSERSLADGIERPPEQFLSSIVQRIPPRVAHRN
jgi:hypothetical protein